MEVSRQSRGVGGWASIALGISYLLVAAGYFLQPEPQRTGSVDDYLGSLATDPLGFTILNWSLALGGLAGLAAVPWIASLVGRRHEDWIAWARNLGLLGFAVAAVNGFRTLNLAREEAANFVHELIDEPGKLSIRGDFIHLSLDPDGWMTFGAVGLFVLIVAVAALRERAIAPALGAVGIAAGVAYWLVVLGGLLGADWLISVAAAAGGALLGPIFYIWIGLSPRQPGDRAPAPATL